MPDKKLRHSIRLKHYDYSQAGAYFVTICTKDKSHLFGEIVEGLMSLNRFGEIVKTCWGDLPKHYPQMQSDVFVVMPNHVHGINVLVDLSDIGAGLKPAPTAVKRHGLSEIIRAFKTYSSRQINELRGRHGIPIWQRNYYEHVIQNENDLNEIREYIVNNPLKWDLDGDNPDNW